MTKRMLIDASHAEETRVVVLDGHRIEELDFESQSRKQLRGNIYLAKVTRVEPSLQAAFIEYGGNKHGFLAFNEIHPDYYQIPIADREALMREEAEEEEEHARRHGNGGGRGHEGAEASQGDDAVEDDDDDVMEEELERRRRRLLRRYKIQEVIRRRQIMLVQVVKEERGNKGAALTTYLSLAGRYGVLMPNTARGGGISRKITTATDRKRLKKVVDELDVPQGMGLIIRTAGAKRTKAEIKRDYDYLLRLWENIRETTLKSIAPALIYEEEDLVKRAVRDMFDKDLDGILVEGEAGYREARDFMRMIMPSQAKKVIHYKEPTPLFVAHRIEDQLAQIHSPVVPLRSGGYLVINQTEALVAIDVNSGKSTRERNIEATALKTNLEAAEEAARQLRLRDLAGLIVIDFIDMDEAKNNRAVEKKLKDCLKDDRARVQIGKISSFGLMEISRQRRRSGVLEGTTHVCEHCQGTGRVRSVESSALAALRAVEMEAVRGGPGAITLRLPTDVALYILNEKRAHLSRLEQVQGLKVAVAVEAALTHAEHEIERTAAVEGAPRLESTTFNAPRIEVAASQAFEADEADEAVFDEPDVEEDEDDAAEAPGERSGARSAGREAESADGERGRRRRRRRRGGRGRDDAGPGEARAARDPDSDGDEDEADADAEASEGGELVARADGAEAEDSERARRRRRRGRRGGRRMREEGGPERRAEDPYAWVTPPRVGRDEDPYVWKDPMEAGPPAVAFAAHAERTAEPEVAGQAHAEAEPAPAAQGAFVETPISQEAPEDGASREDGVSEATAAKPARARKPRAPRAPRGKAAQAAAAEAAAEATPEAAPAEPDASPLQAEAPAIAPEPAPAAPEASPETAPAMSPAMSPAAASPEREPVAPARPPAPDPAEISAPPTQPRRGWWRRLG